MVGQMDLSRFPEWPVWPSSGQTTGSFFRKATGPPCKLLEGMEEGNSVGRYDSAYIRSPRGLTLTWQSTLRPQWSSKHFSQLISCLPLLGPVSPRSHLLSQISGYLIFLCVQQKAVLQHLSFCKKGSDGFPALSFPELDSEVPGSQSTMK